jgi:hypothetical protein
MTIPLMTTQTIELAESDWEVVHLPQKNPFKPRVSVNLAELNPHLQSSHKAKNPSPSHKVDMVHFIEQPSQSSSCCPCSQTITKIRHCLHRLCNPSKDEDKGL